MKWLKNRFTKPPQYEDQIRHILVTFDFERVADEMGRMGWEWVSGREKYVPNVNQLEETAEYLLRLITQTEEPCMEAATGGFRAYYAVPPTWYRRGTLALKFEVASYAHGEEEG